MEAVARSFRVLGRLLFSLLALLPRRRGIGLVALRDLQLSLVLLCAGLRPRTVPLGGAASVHVWAPAERRRRPALLLVHGFGGDAKWQWGRQVAALARDFDLYVPDLVFFGRSRCDGHDPDRSVGFQARCVAGAMRELGVASYAVCGISYGGFVAYRMAAVTKGVERLIIMTAGVGTTAEERRELAGREGRDVAELLVPRKADDLTALMNRSMHRPPRWLPQFLLRDFIEVMYKDHRQEKVELLKDLMANGVGLDPLPVLNQETLILWGDRDNVFPLHLAYQLQGHLGEKARLEIIKDAGHALQLEKPDTVNHLIECFLLDSSNKR